MPCSAEHYRVILSRLPSFPEHPGRKKIPEVAPNLVILLCAISILRAQGAGEAAIVKTDSTRRGPCHPIPSTIFDSPTFATAVGSNDRMGCAARLQAVRKFRLALQLIGLAQHWLAPVPLLAAPMEPMAGGAMKNQRTNPMPSWTRVRTIQRDIPGQH